MERIFRAPCKRLRVLRVLEACNSPQIKLCTQNLFDGYLGKLITSLPAHDQVSLEWPRDSAVLEFSVKEDFAVDQVAVELINFRHNYASGVISIRSTLQAVDRSVLSHSSQEAVFTFYMCASTSTL